MKVFEPFYGFTMNPFDKALGEKYAFPSYDHKEMMNRLSFFQNSHGIGVFTAAPGQGKTFTLRCFASSLNPQLYRVVYICMSTLSITDFYRQLCAALSLDIMYHKSTMFRSIQEYLLSCQREKRVSTIIVIDEANHLKTEILQDFKMLLNFFYDSVYPFTLILIGEPYLNRVLDKGIHDALRQRIAVHYDFKGLGKEEMEAYVQHKFNVAGASFREIIGEGVMAAIEAGCNGNPRLVDQMMTKALTAGAQRQQKVIDTDLILWAADSIAL
jgi:type II secretory pathway predicted ATPase ExeA